MEYEQTIDRFVDLFRGNEEFYGTDKGGCVEASNDWDQIGEWHLTGRIEPVGVYPIYLNEVVHWGCVDIDLGYDEGLPHAKNLVAVLAEFGIKAWIERSRSKGYHVWVFSNGLSGLLARDMRRALLAGCQVVEAPLKEVNPKQEYLQPGQVGNYVRLPYPGALDAASRGYAQVYKDHRQAVLGRFDAGIEPVEWFVESAWEQRTENSKFITLANLYAPPKNHLLVPTRDFSNVEGDLWARLRGLARKLFEEGPREGIPVTDKDYNNGRSSRLWKLACLLREDANHSVDEVVTILQEADRRWGKFHFRPNGDDEIVRLVYKVYGMGDHD